MLIPFVVSQKDLGSFLSSSLKRSWIFVLAGVVDGQATTQVMDLHSELVALAKWNVARRAMVKRYFGMHVKRLVFGHFSGPKQN